MIIKKYRQKIQRYVAYWHELQLNGRFYAFINGEATDIAYVEVLKIFEEYNGKLKQIRSKYDSVPDTAALHQLALKRLQENVKQVKRGKIFGHHIPGCNRNTVLEEVEI